MRSLSLILCSILSILHISCSDWKQTEYENIRQRNLISEFIYWTQEDWIEATSAEQRIREEYPWEQHFVGNHPRITKDFFRCKGGRGARSREGGIIDCNGHHGLPVKQGKEFIYPTLIDLLNFIQAKTGKRVIILSAHRCPQHHTFIDTLNANPYSKHMLGAEVDFYVQGLEHEAAMVIQWIMNYYREAPYYQGKPEYQEFRREDSHGKNNLPSVWINKEIIARLYSAQQGEDTETTVPYPHINIQLRYDITSGEKIVYSWDKAHHHYLR